MRYWHGMDARTFTRMFNTHADPVYKFLYYRLNNAEQAQDVTSIVFTKAWEARDTYKGPSEQAWIFTIARNTLIDTYRKKKDVPINESDEFESDEDIADTTDKKLMAERLHKAMDKLPEDLRDIVHMRHIEHISVRDTAIRLGITEENVRVKNHRALIKLRILYEKTS